eukprot:177427_1
MKDAIIFRSMLDTLNPYEFESFVARLLTKRNKRNIITKSLFYLMIDEWRRCQPDYTEDIITIISNILHERPQQSQSRPQIHAETDSISDDRYSSYPAETDCISFCDLPQAMVSECASYLHFSELPSFLHCSRHIYVSCKIIPTTVTSLDEKEWFREFVNNYGEAGRVYQLNRLDQYRMTQEISMGCINQINQNIWKWNRLNTVHIHNLNTMYSPLQISVVSRIIQRTNIKYLKLSEYKPIENANEFDILLRMICANRGIEFLNIANIRCSLNVLQSMRDSFGFEFDKLKGLIARTSIPYIYNKILSHNNQSAQLESFHIERDEWEPYEFDADIKEYYNLKELCITNMNGIQFKHIIDSAIGLQRLHWRLPSTRLHHYREILHNVLATNRYLNYLCIDSSQSNHSIKHIIEPIYCLLTSDVNGRYNFKLKLVLLSMTDLVYMQQHLLHPMVNAMHNAVTNDFMFICDISDTFKVFDHDFEWIANEFNNDLYKCRAIKDRQEYIVRFAIYNIDNKMCGFNERFIMKCPKCCNIDDYGI